MKIVSGALQINAANSKAMRQFFIFTQISIILDEFQERFFIIKMAVLANEYKCSKKNRYPF